MEKRKRDDTLAIKLVKLMGGRDNIVYFVHCKVRLYFNVKDKSLVNVNDIESLEGVVSTKCLGNQYQIDVFQNVSEAYDLICKSNGLTKEKNIDEDFHIPFQNLKKNYI